MPEKKGVVEKTRFCQECRFHSNRPGYCSVKQSFMARKELKCVEFKLKKGKA